MVKQAIRAIRLDSDIVPGLVDQETGTFVEVMAHAAWRCVWRYAVRSAAARRRAD